jgi:hypothetical protein
MNIGPTIQALVRDRHIETNSIPKPLFVLREAENVYSFQNLKTDFSPQQFLIYIYILQFHIQG